MDEVFDGQVHGFYPDDLELSTATTETLEEGFGSSGADDEPGQQHLVISGDIYLTLIVHGGRDAAQQLAARLQAFVDDDEQWIPEDPPGDDADD